jgi:hypothetical protein
MKQVANALIILLVSLAGAASAQFKFLPDIKYQAAFGPEIRLTSGWPYPLSAVAVNEWSDMSGRTAGNSYIADYQFKSMVDLVMIGVNRNTLAVVSPYQYKVSVNIFYKIANPLFGGFSSASKDIVLFLSYHPDSLRQYNDLSVHKFSGAEEFTASITDVQRVDPVSGALSPVAPSAIAANFFIKTEIHAQRYDKKNMNLLAAACSLSAGNKNLNVSCYFHTSPTGDVATGTTAYKPASYELEWTYVDDYKCNPATGEITYGFTSSPVTQVLYDFRKNSTRVQLDKPYFSIPLVYEHGAIVFRFRAVRPVLSDYAEILYGPWTLGDNGALSISDPAFAKKACLVQSHTSDQLNWQYTINFAEQGNYKHVVSYFDGALKDRQTQTRINSDEGYIVAVEKVYDYEGRPSLVSLPTPVAQDGLNYRSDVLKHAVSGNPYQAEDFDFLGCSRPGPINALDAGAAAHIYYSPLNPDKSGMQKFVPDAQGFPMVQTVYSPDNTNKVQWQGGAGKEQQLSEGHGTRYEYVRAVQPELDKFLGTEVGYDRFYPKQIVTDPNGQSSYSILNPQGKVIISGLQSAAPDSAVYSVERLPNFVPGQEVCLDLLKNAAQDKLKNGLEFYTTFYNDGAGANTLTYSIKTTPYNTGCSSKTLWLRGIYDVNVTDDCGREYTALSASDEIKATSLANGNFISNPGHPLYGGLSNAYKKVSRSSASVPQGKILIDKKVTFSEYEADTLVRRFIKTSEPACFRPEEYFIRTAVESTEFPCTKGEEPDRQETSCEGIRELMIAELFPDAKYGKYQYAGMSRRFGGQKENSIFSIVEDVDPGVTSGRINGHTSRCDIQGCVVHGSCSDDSGEGCACTERHFYPFRCCDECVLKECACIAFPKVLIPGTSTTTSLRTCTNLPEIKRYYHWGGSMVDDFPSPRNRDWEDGPLYISEGIILPAARYYYHWQAEVVVCNCGYNEDTVWKKYYTNYPPAISSGSLVFGPTLKVDIEDPGRPVRSGSHNCLLSDVKTTYTEGTNVKTYYRYQSECILYPDMVLGGRLYTAADIKKLDPQAFMNLFNRRIAEALLPLHPEYCKLMNCEGSSTTFEESFAALETYQAAEAAGLFTLDDIVAKDPYPAWVAARQGSTLGEPHRNILKYPYQLETAQGGGYTPIISPPLPLNKQRLDKQVLAKMYCGTGNYEEMLNCYALRYTAEIDASPVLITDPVLKQRYFREMQARYLANRSIVRQMYLDYQNSHGGCEVCPHQRMNLIDSPLFRGFLNYILDAEGNVVRIEEDENFATLPQWKKDLYLGTSSTIPAEFFDQYNAQKDEAAQAEAEAIMQALRNCPVSDPAALQEDLKTKIKSGIRITPDLIRESIIASSAGGASALGELCNSFLVAYGLFPDEQKTKTETASFACGDPALFSGLESFFNRIAIKSMLASAPSSPITGAGTTISVSRGGVTTGNVFENKVLDYFGYPTPATSTNYDISVGAIVKKLDPSCSGDCIQYVELVISSGISPLSVKLNIQAAVRPDITANNLGSVIAGMSSPWSADFLNPSCLNDDKSDNSGLLSQKAASIEVKCNEWFCLGRTRYFVWNDRVDFMTPAYDQTALADAINCRDIGEALTAFGATDKSLHVYSDKVNHPYYEKVLTNYLNHRFNRAFSYRQYRDLMEGCALGDQLALDRQVAAARIEFASDAYADIFEVQIAGITHFQPGLFRYKPSGATQPVVLVDLGPINENDRPLYLKYLSGDISGTFLPAIMGVSSRTMHYRPAVNMLFTPSACAFSASVFPAGTATYAGTPVAVWENEEYRAFTLHEFSSSAATPTPLQKAELIAAADNYRRSTDACKTSYAFYNTDKLRSSDYGTPFKQAYLSYIAGLGPVSRGTYLAAIDPATLSAALSGYTGRSFSYKSPFCTGLRNHLYTYKPNPTAVEAPGYDIVKNTIISNVVAGGGKLFPDADITYKATAPADFNEQLTIIRKANGNYWYRYFDNTTHKMYNLYVAPPAQKMARALQDYNFSAIEMGPDPNTFLLIVNAPAVPASGSGLSYKPALPEVTLKCLGYAGFNLADTSLIAADVLLHQGSGTPRCFDSLDCEKNLLTTAILNGKAAYYQYFEANVATVTSSLFEHLIRTTKDTLIYCGRQQQYQQTLYYYDRVGNLTHTVPPAGVTPLGDVTVGIPGGYKHAVSEAEKYRDNPSAYLADYPPSGTFPYITFPNPRLTRHNKVSSYKYNSLNQLTWQQTPDGGISSFFYDAAGRQVFSQNSEQRPLGFYTYNLYDAQGRPEESGQIKLANFANPVADPDNTPYIVSYRTRTSATYDTTYTAMHPDFITNSSDEKTYPYEDLKYFIRMKGRRDVVLTAYDEAIRDLGAISGEMLSTQENLRNRVAAIRYYETVSPLWGPAPGDPLFGTHYSYDLSGNVKTITYDFPRLQYDYNIRYHRVDYDYDLVSGKVNMISYNRGHPDQFYQQYDYDADNRITTVKTSNDGLIWNKDARYKYYRHGPLASLQLGEHQVQSLEYAYTIQGWLKAINGDVLNPAKDMGQNGLDSDATYPRDVIAHALRYFSDDYKPIGTTPATNIPDATAKNLYNGNITQQTTGIGGLGTLQRVYSYDQLQRLKLATNARVNDNSLLVSTTPANLYKSTYSYDMDGNIGTLQRWDGNTTTPVQIDNFAYRYEGYGTSDPPKNNKLLQVEDLAAVTTGSDLQPGQPADNYSYDRIGNLVRDKQGAEQYIRWDRFGKVITMYDSSTATRRYSEFCYDGRGNRIYKELSVPQAGTGNKDKTGEYYVRDAGGNILAVYRLHSVFDRLVRFKVLVVEGTGVISPTDASGTALTDVLTGSYTGTSLIGGLKGAVLGSHSGWVTTYTNKPIGFYWNADPTLRSTLLYSGSAWIDAMRTERPDVHRNALLLAGTAVQPLFFSAMDQPTEGRKLIQHYSTQMPMPVCQSIWNSVQAQYIPGNHVANATSLYAKMTPQQKPMLLSQMTQQIQQNFQQAQPQSASFYNAVMADNSVWSAPALRAQNGPWTSGITQIVNMYANDGGLQSFFNVWSGGPSALAAAVTPAYKLDIVYDAAPYTATRDMCLATTADELTAVVSGISGITYYGLKNALVNLGIDEARVNEGERLASSGDTLSLAEHHIYGSSRLGVQRYDSVRIANILHLPEGSSVQQRSTLRNLVPWYSYDFADLVDSTKRSPWAPGLTANAYTDLWNTNRTLGRKYYELTDHLGNVLATVLDRKTGATLTGAPPVPGGLYDHWHADIAQASDYYPGGMMMPGRYKEYDWSRMGYNKGSAKDDEVYGKGNLFTTFFREGDTRLLRWWSNDPKADHQPFISPYQFMNGNTVNLNDHRGDCNCPHCILLNGTKKAGLAILNAVSPPGGGSPIPTVNIAMTVRTPIDIAEGVESTVNMVRAFPDAAPEDKVATAEILIVQVLGLVEMGKAIRPKTPTVDILTRAREIHAALPEATQRRTTTAVAQAVTEDGSPIVLVGSSEVRLRPAQRSALRANEVAVKGEGHAEVTILNFARDNNMKVKSVAASRPICEGCAGSISTSGANAASPLKKGKAPPVASEIEGR